MKKFLRRMFVAESILICIAVAVLAGRMFVYGGIEATILTIVSALAGAGACWTAREAADISEEDEDD